MNSTTATKTVEEMRRLFTTHGLLEQLVSDKGPQFVAEEFRSFVRNKGIKYIRSTPYHPATKWFGRVIRTNVQTSSAGAATERKPLSWKLVIFKIAYRTTPHATTGKTPAMLHRKEHSDKT